MDVLDQGVEVVKQACGVRDGFQRSQSRDKVGAPRRICRKEGHLRRTLSLFSRALSLVLKSGHTLAGTILRISDLQALWVLLPDQSMLQLHAKDRVALRQQQLQCDHLLGEVSTLLKAKGIETDLSDHAIVWHLASAHDHLEALTFGGW